MAEVIGRLTWEGCIDGCKHARKDRGGCEMLDKHGQRGLEIDLDSGLVYCIFFMKKEEGTFHDIKSTKLKAMSKTLDEIRQKEDTDG